MTEIDSFLAAVAAEVDEQPERLLKVLASSEPAFLDAAYLPNLLREIWPSLPLSARCVAILFAAHVADENLSAWDNYDK